MILGVLRPSYSRKNLVFAGVFAEIPYSTEQGLFFDEQGIFRRNKEFSANNRESCVRSIRGQEPGGPVRCPACKFSRYSTSRIRTYELLITNSNVDLVLDDARKNAAEELPATFAVEPKNSGLFTAFGVFSSHSLTATDSAATARTPPGPARRARVTSR